MHKVWLVLLAGFAAAVVNWGYVHFGVADESAVDYKRDIWPVLEETCSRCHSAKKKDGGLNMSTRAAMLKGGHSGPALVPGKVEKSLMLELIEFDEMPPRKEKPRVSKEQFAKLRAWIAAGAKVPADAEKETPSAGK
jgi:mono/diheme cytochrome c family protein